MKAQLAYEGRQLPCIMVWRLAILLAFHFQGALDQLRGTGAQQEKFALEGANRRPEKSQKNSELNHPKEEVSYC